MVITPFSLPTNKAARIEHPGQFSIGITQLYWSIFKRQQHAYRLP
jgi:hypothetical protein